MCIAQQMLIIWTTTSFMMFAIDSLFTWLNYQLYNIFVENDYKTIPHPRQIHPTNTHQNTSTLQHLQLT